MTPLLPKGLRTKKNPAATGIETYGGSDNMAASIRRDMCRPQPRAHARGYSLSPLWGRAYRCRHYIFRSSMGKTCKNLPDYENIYTLRPPKRARHFGIASLL
jgi:hypothetical protein